MRKLTHKGNHKGFTIIEVLIVLAIAGLIMVVVFLAVPALNRNAHNSQYKTEASNLLGAYQEVSNNNGGAALTVSGNDVADGDALAVKNAANVKTLKDVSITDFATTPAPTPLVGAGVFVVGAKCTATNKNATTQTTGATSRNVAFVYRIEAASGTTYQCIDQ